MRLVSMTAPAALWIAALFLGAGRLDWPRGWFCVALYIVGMGTLAVVVHRANAPLMEARAKWARKDTRSFDKVFFAVLLPLVYAQPALAGMDAVRFGWSRMPGVWAYGGAVLFALAMGLITWVMAINRHAEATVRIQSDRDHRVISSGPYRVIRHPMYVGAILMYLATALVLGSAWALLPACAMAACFAWRTAREDDTLRRELPGYEDFASRTRYRLFPGVW
ncbi:MAG TPA: isoprenylcysteine carboxylmethyltransferase family protein [Bryobacteraceae bacterium]|nr:isoprenylcysteine carboxylmethyltransferase family protein [Bryobacteraceae bacterium]